MREHVVDPSVEEGHLLGGETGGDLAAEEEKVGDAAAVGGGEEVAVGEVVGTSPRLGRTAEHGGDGAELDQAATRAASFVRCLVTAELPANDASSVGGAEASALELSGREAESSASILVAQTDGRSGAKEEEARAVAAPSHGEVKRGGLVERECVGGHAVLEQDARARHVSVPNADHERSRLHLHPLGGDVVGVGA
jgi:hypothetical protein